MNILFNLQYATVFGETLQLNVVDRNGAKAQTYGMNMTADKTWTCQMAVDASVTHIDYYFSVDRGGQEERHEWTTITHRLELNGKKTDTYLVSNRWQDIPGDSYLYSSAFTDCVNRRNHGRMKASAYAKTLRLVVRAPQLRGGCQLAVVGEDKALGLSLIHI